MSAASDPLQGAKLRAVLMAFRSELKPELSSPYAKLRGELIDMMLSRLTVEAEGGGLEAGSEQSIEEIASGERARRDAYEKRVEAARTAQPEGASSATELDIPAETFTQWLGRHEPGATVEKVTTVPGGRSKGTILLDVSGGTRDRIVIRRDFAAAVTGTSVSAEFPIIRAVHRAGLKVPEPLWLEDDPAVIGGRFIAFERLAGRSMGTLFESDASPAFAREFAAALAALHQLDLDALGVAPELRWGEEENPVAAMLDSFEERYRKGVQPTPLMDAAFAWLRGQLPAIGNVRGLVHGDAGLHNTLGEEDRLTGLLDWEFVHAGDPAEDLAYCRYLIERVLPWTEFMQAYEAAGGAPVSDARMRFFGVWRTLHLSILTGLARSAFDKGVDRDLRVLAIGHNTFPRQLRDLAGDLARAVEAT